MTKASVNSFESFGLVDGPGIRTIIFLNGCKLRCKFCHNPEMWNKQEYNYEVDEIVKKILRNKPYFNNNGGVTFSGGEPLLHDEFLIEICQKLKKENIHIAIDTAGIGNGNYERILENIDLVLLDIKHITKEGFIDITCLDKYDEFMNFIKELNNSKKDVWIRQVIIPGVNDTEEYIKDMIKFIKENINNVKRIDLLPYHTMGKEKYHKLGIIYPYEDKEPMSKEKCLQLNELANNLYNQKN